MPPTQDVQPVTPITPPATTQNPTNVVSLGELQNPTPIVEAPPIQMQDFTKFTQQFQANTAQEQAGVDSARQNIRDIGGQLATQGQRGAQLDEQFGLNAAYDQSAQLNDQIAQLSNAFNLAITNEEGVARPIEFITGRQAFLQRQKATQLEALAATQAALNGNIALAEQRVATALEREFGDLEALLDTQLFELDQNKEALTAKDAKATAELERALLERSRQLEVQKENKKQILNYATEAASNGAPNEITSRITQASSPEEALALAGQYVGLLDRQQAQASIANSYSAISDRNRRFDLELKKFAQETVDSVNAKKAEAATVEEAQRIENKAKGDKALSMLVGINELATHPGLAGSVGPNPLARVNFSLLGGALFTEAFTGDKSAFKSEVDRLSNTLTLENMELLKGPATDKDVEIVAASMSRLKNMDVTEASYAEELGRLQAATQRIVDEVGVTSEQLSYYGLADEETVQEADIVWGAPDNTNAIDFNY